MCKNVYSRIVYAGGALSTWVTLFMHTYMYVPLIIVPENKVQETIKHMTRRSLTRVNSAAYNKDLSNQGHRQNFDGGFP